MRVAHAKPMVIDPAVTLMGSMNSAVANSEDLNLVSSPIVGWPCGVFAQASHRPRAVQSARSLVPGRVSDVIGEGSAAALVLVGGRRSRDAVRLPVLDALTGPRA